MRPECEAEIARLVAACSEPSAIEPTVRAAMEFAYKDSAQACLDRFPYHLQPWAGELTEIEKHWGYAANAIKANIEGRLK